MAEAALPCTQCVFAISTNSVARAVPPYCNAILAQSMRAQHASNTTAHALTITLASRLPSFKRLAIALFGYQAGVTQMMKPAVREARGTCRSKLREGRLQACPPCSEYSDRGHVTRR